MALQTTNERIAQLEEKVDKVLRLLNPETEPDNRELFEKFDALKEEIKAYLDNLRHNYNLEGEDVPDDEKFNRNMWYYAAAGFSFAALATVVTYKVALFFFPLSFSLFFAYSLILLGLLHDKFLLPGNTIKRIASNAVSASIFWLAFTIASVAGFAIGNSIISDPFGGEERGAKANAEGYIEAPAARGSGDTIQLGPGGATED